MSNGGTAFPVVFERSKSEYGMSLRDYFAAHAPEHPDGGWRGGDCTAEEIAAWRWRYADAMIKERERK